MYEHEHWKYAYFTESLQSLFGREKNPLNKRTDLWGGQKIVCCEFYFSACFLSYHSMLISSTLNKSYRYFVCIIYTHVFGTKQTILINNTVFILIYYCFDNFMEIFLWIVSTMLDFLLVNISFTSFAVQSVCKIPFRRENLFLCTAQWFWILYIIINFILYIIRIHCNEW